MPRRRALVKKERPLSPDELGHAPDPDIPGQELLDALARIRQHSTYSDVTILCHGDVHLVHKCIVCTRSAFFARACDGGFQEASTQKVSLDEEPALVKQMVDYLYTLDYQVEGRLLECNGTSCEGSSIPDSSIDEEIPSQYGEREGGPGNNGSHVFEATDKPPAAFDPLTFHILMYSLADRMLIEGLKVLSKQKVQRELVGRLDMNSFPRAILEIYKSTPANDRGLRDLAVMADDNYTTDKTRILPEFHRNTCQGLNAHVHDD